MSNTSRRDARSEGVSIASSQKPTLSLWAAIRILLARSLLRSARSLALWIAPELAENPEGTSD